MEGGGAKDNNYCFVWLYTAPGEKFQAILLIIITIIPDLIYIIVL